MFKIFHNYKTKKQLRKELEEKEFLFDSYKRAYEELNKSFIKLKERN